LEYSDRGSEVEQLKKEDVTGFLGVCEDLGEKRSSVILRLLICKKYFAWARDQRLTGEDPAAAIPVPKEERKAPRFVSVAQIEALLKQPNTETPAGLRDRAVLEVIYSAGLRISEALALEIRDINFEEGFLHVRNGKGDKGRTIPVGSPAAHWLTRYLQEGRRKLLSCSCTELVFVNNSGQRMSRQLAAAAIRGYVSSAGLPGWLSAHGLRHAMASHMLSSGAGLPYIQEQLGHTCLESTRIYLAVRSDDLKNVHAATHPRG
jgi:integrase/recombinase XerD